MTAPRRRRGPDVSRHRIAVYRVLLDVYRTEKDGGWLTNLEIEEKLVQERRTGHVPRVAPSTVRRATGQLAGVGLLRQVAVHPIGYKYQINTGPLNGLATAYRSRLHTAAAAIGQPLDIPERQVEITNSSIEEGLR